MTNKDRAPGGDTRSITPSAVLRLLFGEFSEGLFDDPIVRFEDDRIVVEERDAKPITVKVEYIDDDFAIDDLIEG